MPITVDTSRSAELALLVERLSARLEAGKPVDLEEIAREYPQHASELRELLPAVALMVNLSRSGQTSGFVAEDPLGELGDFRLLREVGRGGMGVVYEAEQISLNRRVALKVLPYAATMDPKQLQRFKNESRAAASLRHEHIVHVYGVGCERGVHYYAMEFIDGLTLAQAIAGMRESKDEGGRMKDEPKSKDEGGRMKDVSNAMTCSLDSSFILPPSSFPATAPIAALSTQLSGPNKREFYRTAARLIADAADALEHAHSLGIVHRDVKPGNLLLDQAGKVWVADFGLARLGADAGLTMSGDLLGTLRYMAPEQAMSRHGLVDHRTDIYGLGCTLYELLTGHPAVDATERAEVLRQIAFEEPTAPRKCDKAIPAELETIALKALAKNPNERYATAGELAEDLRRFADDRPIRARRPTVRQRLARWGRRHPGLTVALGLAVGLLLTGAWAWDREKTQAETAARTVAGESDQLRDGDRFPEALLAAERAADLLPRYGGDATLRQQIAGRIADLQLLNRLEQAQLDRAVQARDGAGWDKELAATLYQRAFQDYGVDVVAGDEPTILNGLGRPAVVARVAAALGSWERTVSDPATKERLGRLAEALDKDERKLISRLRRAEAAKDVEALKRLAVEVEIDLPPPLILTRLGVALTDVSCFREAERLLRAGHQVYPADIWVNTQLGNTLLQSRKQVGGPDLVLGVEPTQAAEAVGFFRAALALRPLSAGLWLNLGTALYEAGRREDAATTIRRAIVLSPNNFNGHNNLGSVLINLGRYAESEAELRRAIALKPDSPDAHLNLGRCLTTMGDRLAEAEAECRRAIELKPDWADAHFNLCIPLCNQGRYTEAEAACRRAIELKPDWAEAHCNRANVLKKLGRPAEAEAAYRRAIELKPDLAPPHCNLGNLLYSRGRLAEAAESFRRAVELRPDDADAPFALAHVLHDLGRSGEAIDMYRRVIALRPDLAEAHCNLGHDLRRKGEFSQAVAELRIGHELGSKRKDWPYPSAEWVREAEHFAAVDKNLQAFLSGAAQPNDAEESLKLALICHQNKKLFADAARFYAGAFEADPKLAEQLHGHRYNAACAAAVAGCGQREGATMLDDTGRARLRRQALEWLTTELAARAKLAEKPTDRPKLRQTMQHWQQDSDFAGVREAAALAKLPEAERAAWQKLWAGVADLLKRTEEPSVAEKRG